jgi:hypothetical protein
MTCNSVQLSNGQNYKKGQVKTTLSAELQTLQIDQHHESVITEMATNHRAQFSNRLG